MGGVAGNLVEDIQPWVVKEHCGAQQGMKPETHLVPQTLAGNDGNLIANTLVGLEVQGQFRVVTFNYDFGRFLDCLRANATLQFASPLA